MGFFSIEYFDMIRFDCEDLKRGLVEVVRGLVDEFFRKVFDDYRRENKRYNEDCVMFKFIYFLNLFYKMYIYVFVLIWFKFKSVMIIY